MHKFTNRDIALFAKLNVKVIFDLRTRSERILEPRNSDLRSTEILEFPDRHGGSLENFAAFIDDPNTNGPAMVEAMKQMYRELLIEQKTSYSAIFSKLVAGDLPLVVQCTAGKDRTGIIVALILATLDVPEDAIIADYMLSEQIVDLRNAFDAIEKNRMVGGMREEVIIAVLRSDNRYIQAALDAAKEKHGSVVAFVKAEYGVSDDDLTQIRKRLLVPDRPHFEAPVSPKARS
jgi:protein-tyrosine phosphatase